MRHEPLPQNDPLLTEQEVEQMLRLSRGALAVARCKGRSTPPAMRVGLRAIRYRQSAVEAWLTERAITSTTTK